MTTRPGFTLFEILASMLLLAVGVMSVVGLMMSAMRANDEAIAAATGTATALTLINDPAPGGLTADVADADSDGWACDNGTVTGRTFDGAGAENFIVSGFINGYWIRREESSTVADIIDARSRWSTVQVEVYQGRAGRQVAALKRKVLRTW